MATATHYISGTAEGFIRLNSPDEKYDNFYVGLSLNEASKAEFAASGMQMETKVSQEGKEFITFRRPNKKVIKDELVKFGAPKVIDKDSNPVTAFVGKGSELTLKVIVYDTVKGKGHRLEAVRVDKLVEYKPQPKEAAADGSPSKQMPF
jgi:hypothetical protein